MVDTLIDNGFFRVEAKDTETGKQLFFFQIKYAQEIPDREARMLIHSLNMVCEATDRKSLIIFDTRGIQRTSLQFKFFNDHMKGLKGIGSAGMQHFCIITESSAVRHTAKLLGKLAGTLDRVSVVKTPEEALARVLAAG